jgi:hypothetical protein
MWALFCDMFIYPILHVLSAVWFIMKFAGIIVFVWVTMMAVVMIPILMIAPGEVIYVTFGPVCAISQLCGFISSCRVLGIGGVSTRRLRGRFNSQEVKED